ncbi:MAG: double-strand break repair helicase AddA [Pseudolabrys sp.]
MSVTRDIPPDARKRQHEAADPDMSVFVSANAGSGKTHVLVQRVINLLLQGVDPSTILCITYTKAAAANMSGRVFKTLADWSTLGDDDLDTAIKAASNVKPAKATRDRARRLFAQALETPGGLKVQTIHAFCTRLLHQFPFEADVAARFTVMDEAQTQQLLDRLTLEILLEASAAPDSALGRALSDAIGFAADQTLKEVVADAIKKREALTEWFTRAGGFTKAMAELAGALGVAPEDGLQAIENEYFSGSVMPEAAWPDFAAFLSASDKDTDRKVIGKIEALRHLAGRERADAYAAIFLTGDGKPRKNVITANFAKSNPQWNDRIAAEQGRILALKQRERAVTAYARTHAMLTIAQEVIGRYRSEKDRRALLDYDDLIDKTAALFHNTAAAWVLYKLDAGIDHVLIDEAQDTSPKQWDIIRTIVSEFTPGGARANTRRTMFAVGDEKQSIFSFQGAAPREFDRMRRLFAQQFDSPDMGWRYVRLEHSFRSGANVLGAVDHVFQDREIFASVTADIAGVPPHIALPDAAPGLVELWELTAPAEKRELEGWDAPFDTVSEQSPPVMLARRIAATVKAWMAAGTAPGDVLILVRQRNALFEAIIRALKQADIPVAGADRLVLTEHIAVMDLMVLADALLLPDDDLALATALKSPLFNFDDDQLFKLAWGRTTSLRSTLRAKTSDDPMFAAAARALDRLADAAQAMSPFAFYADVLGTGGRRSILARLGHEAVDALDEFLNLALDYETRETASLQGFVHWMRSAKSEIKRDMELARDEVRVMTVHGAKGLEAKNVILADTTAKPAGPRDPKLLALPLNKAAPGAQAVVWATAKAGDTDAMGDAREAAQIDAQDEHRRLLYVAMTRAAERLVVCGARGKNEPPDGCWYRLVEGALKEKCVGEPDDIGQETVLRFRKQPPADKPATETAVAMAKQPHALPPWLGKTVVTDVASLVRVKPSDAGDDRSPGAPSAGVSRANALQRGNLVHRLLQSLPDLAPDRRGDAARQFLTRAARHLPQNERETIIAQALGLFADERFAALFAPGSRAEVPIEGRIARPGTRALTVSGTIDRLVVTADAVLIADYKTNRPAPRTLDDAMTRFPGYARQLALYRAVLAQLYPTMPLRAALVWTDVPDFMELSSEALDAALAQVTSA